MPTQQKKTAKKGGGFFSRKPNPKGDAAGPAAEEPGPAEPVAPAAEEPGPAEPEAPAEEQKPTRKGILKNITDRKNEIKANIKAKLSNVFDKSKVFGKKLSPEEQEEEDDDEEQRKDEENKEKLKQLKQLEEERNKGQTTPEGKDAEGAAAAAEGAAAATEGEEAPGATEGEVAAETQNVDEKKSSISDKIKNLKQMFKKPEKTPDASSSASGPGLSIPSSYGSSAEQASSIDKVKTKQEEKIKQTQEEVVKINDESEKKRRELSGKYKEIKKKYDAEQDQSTKEQYKSQMDAITIQINEVYDNTMERLEQIQLECDGDETPIPMAIAKNIYYFIFNQIRAIFKKKELDYEALVTSETALDAITKQVENINEAANEGAEVNAGNLAALVSLAQQIAKSNKPPPSAPAASSAPPIPPDAAKAAAEALGKAGGPGGAEGAAAPGAETGAPGAETGAPGAETGAAPPPAAETPEAETEGDSNKGQDGGGISHKRVHPKYINQISENRNKIFKKELEIINSIRRFHRSHTIRKRDKINSILGLRKSRNHKSHGNSKNTRRHLERHNKRKSTKHIKK
jgi:hypothetical protein